VAGATNPIAWNRYAYVYNNPANATDSSGHFIDTLWDAFNLWSDVKRCVGSVEATQVWEDGDWTDLDSTQPLTQTDTLYRGDLLQRGLNLYITADGRFYPSTSRLVSRRTTGQAVGLHSRG
jgi:hypothetical protein